MTTQHVRGFGPVLRRNATPPLDARRERELLRAAHAGDASARSELVTSHLRLVAAVARRITPQPSEDVLAEGVVGLLEAIQRFDLERDTRLSTYAAHWIRARVQGYLLGNRRIVAAPDTRASRKVFARLSRTERELATRTSSPAPREIAEKIGVAVEDVDDVVLALRTPDVPLDANGASETTADSTENGPEERLARAELALARSRAIERALATLDDRERRVVEERALADEGTTLADLATVLDLSRERVRQLEARALQHIGRALLRQDLVERPRAQRTNRSAVRLSA